jgi:SH3 domain-containing YSC84-like protein 1
MKKVLAFCLSAAMVCLPAISWANDTQKDYERLRNCAAVLTEILNTPEDIPQQLLDKAVCVIVFPDLVKGAFLVGGQYGRGAMTCRTGHEYSGPWSAPTMMALEGGSFGLQIGGQATDLILLVMNDAGAKAVLQTKVKLGADASVAAGPKGRDLEADTTVNLRAEILSYSRTKGVFAGISLAGSSLRPDNDANKRIYGREIPASKIVLSSTVKTPVAAQPFLTVLRQHTPKHVV